MCVGGEGCLVQADPQRPGQKWLSQRRNSGNSNWEWKGCNQETGADSVELSPSKVKTIYEKCPEMSHDQIRKTLFTLENDRSSEIHSSLRERRISAYFAKLEENEAKPNKNSVIPLLFTLDFDLTSFVFASSEIHKTSCRWLPQGEQNQHLLSVYFVPRLLNVLFHLVLANHPVMLREVK